MSLSFTWMLWPAVRVFYLCCSSGLPAPGTQTINFNLSELSQPLSVKHTHNKQSPQLKGDVRIAEHLACFSDMAHFSKSFSTIKFVWKDRLKWFWEEFGIKSKTKTPILLGSESFKGIIVQTGRSSKSMPYIWFWKPECGILTYLTFVIFKESHSELLYGFELKVTFKFLNLSQIWIEVQDCSYK